MRRSAEELRILLAQIASQRAGANTTQLASGPTGPLPPGGNTGTGYTPTAHTHSFADVTEALTDVQHGARAGGTLHAAASTVVAGFLSATDKGKLNAYPSPVGETIGDTLIVQADGTLAFVPASGGGGMANPMTTAGDLIVGGTGGTADRRAIGTTGHVLTVVSGTPAWAVAAAAVTDGDKGDIIVAGAAWSIDPTIATVAGRALMAAADAAAQRTALALGTAATQASTAFAAVSHTHVQTDVTNLVADLAGKASTIHSHTASAITDLQETVEDRISETLLAGANITLTYDDPTGKLTITAAGAANGTLINPMTTAGDLIAGGVSGAPQRVPIGTTGQVLTVVAGAPTWAVGGATTLTPIGTTTVGANTEDMVRNRVMLKKITPTRAGIILGVTALIAGNSNNVYGYMATIYADNADVPGNVIAYMAFDSSVDSYLTTTLRWLTIPLIATVTANTSYWIGFGRKDGNNAVSAPIAYATSGSDRTITSSGDWITDGALITSVATTRDYSLYISLLG